MSIPDLEPTHDTSSPQLFVRSFETPVAAPWDQSRAARMNAEQGSPLPPGEVLISLKRLQAWRSDRPGQFGAAYIMTGDVTGEVRVNRLVEGRAVEFVFRSPKAEQQRRRRFMLDLALAAFIAVSLAGAIAKAVDARHANAEALFTANHALRRALQAQHLTEVAARNAALLEQAGLTGKTGAHLVEDLDWLAHAKSPNAQFDDVRWENGAMVVIADTPDEPFNNPDRTISPAGRNQNAWRVGPRLAAAFASPASASSALSTANPQPIVGAPQ